MTFSLLGWDRVTESVGIVSVTSSVAHGKRCPQFMTNVGIVTSQAITNCHHAVMGLELLALGFTPEECLRATMAQDANVRCRQIAILDARGRTAAFTGDGASDFKGHRIGEDFVAAVNYVAGEAVLTEMVGAFRAASGDLADRLLAGSRAGERAGGDLGGSHSGFLIVVRPDQMQPWGAHVDLRIDWAPDVLPAMTDALAEYRRMEGERMQDPRYSLDGSLPVSRFRDRSGSP